MDNISLESTNRLLKVIIAILLRQRIEQVPTLRDQIAVLTGLGLKPAEIAEILGRSNIYINKELSIMRKNQKGGKKDARQKAQDAADDR